MVKRSPIFRSCTYRDVENRIREFLSGQPQFLSARSMESPRAVGDAIQGILSENFDKILGELCGDYTASFARRAMADLAFTDAEGFYHVVDVKTHRMDTRFNMPNLTSVERLARFYEDDMNYFVVLNVDYAIRSQKIEIERVLFVPVEYLSWDCLTIGALGWGQIQIANANEIIVVPYNSRRTWMLEFCDNLLQFYPKEIEKAKDRMVRFRDVRAYWETKEE